MPPPALLTSTTVSGGRISPVRKREGQDSTGGISGLRWQSKGPMQLGARS